MGDAMRRHVFFIASWFVLLAVICIKTAHAKIKVLAIYVFGDSYVDIGNNEFQASNKTLPPPQGGYEPYGVSFHQKRTVLGRGRWCDRKLVVDFLAEYLDIGGYPFPWFDSGLRSPKDDVVYRGFNFASTSHLMDKHGPSRGEVLLLLSQVEAFAKDARPVIARAFSDSGAVTMDNIGRSVFYISYGTDRFLQELLLNNQFNNHKAAALADDIHEEISRALYRLADVSARHFIVTEMPAVGCMPFVRWLFDNKGPRCVKFVNQMVAQYNKGLRETLRSFVYARTVARVFYGPMYATTLHATRRPTHYSFQRSEACCPIANSRSNTKPAWKQHQARLLFKVEHLQQARRVSVV